MRTSRSRLSDRGCYACVRTLHGVICREGGFISVGVGGVWVPRGGGVRHRGGGVTFRRLFARLYPRVVIPTSVHLSRYLFNGSFPPTETDSDSDPWDGDPSLKWVQ